MSIDLNKLGSLLGLEISAKEHKLYGSRVGYNMSIRYFSNDLTFMVRIYAAVLDKSVRGALTEFGRSRKGYTFIRAWDNRVTAMLTIDRRDTEEAVAGEINAFLELVSSMGFYPCCSTCGRSLPARLYSLSSDDCNLCDDCTALVKEDVDRVNSFFSMQSPSTSKVLIACLIAGILTFIYSFNTSGTIPAVWNGALETGVGVLLACFFIKKLAGKSNKLSAVLSILFCIVFAFAGTVGWFADFFADFNRDNAADVQYVIDYYEQKQQDYSPYATALHSGDYDLASKYYSLEELSDKELKEKYDYNKLITDNQTLMKCAVNFPSLMFSEYGEKMVNGFWKIIIGDIIGAVVIGILIWRKILSMDGLRYKLEPLPLNTVNTYDMFMGGNNGRQ